MLFFFISVPVLWFTWSFLKLSFPLELFTLLRCWAIIITCNTFWGLDLVRCYLLLPHVYTVSHRHVSSLPFPWRPELRSTSIFFFLSFFWTIARVPGINRRMLPSTCAFVTWLNKTLAQPHRGLWWNLWIEKYGHDNFFERERERKVSKTRSWS